MTATTKRPSSRTITISGDYLLSTGDVVYVARKDRVTNNEPARWAAKSDPFRGNMDPHPVILHGWCGTTNDVATYAEGVGVVTRTWTDGRTGEPRTSVRVAARDSRRERELVAALEAAAAAEV